MKKRIDLTGRQFGDLTVLGKAETKQKGRFLEREMCLW